MPLQARQIKTPHRLFLAEFFFSFSPRTYDLNSFRCLFCSTFLLLQDYFYLIIFTLNYVYIILYSTLYDYAHMETFLRIFVCVPTCDLTSRVAGRRQLSNFQWYYFFSPPPSTSRNYEITGFRSGYRKKAFRKLVCTSVIVSPNNHHNNRPGRCECSVRLL